MAELVDALDLGSSGATRESSSLSFRTKLLPLVRPGRAVRALARAGWRLSGYHPSPGLKGPGNGANLAGRGGALRPVTWKCL